MSDRDTVVARLADEAAWLIDRMHFDFDRLFEILAVKLSDAELVELSDGWYVEVEGITDEYDLSANTTLGEWVAWAMSGNDGGEYWLAPPRRPSWIEDMLAEEPPAA